MTRLRKKKSKETEILRMFSKHSIVSLTNLRSKKPLFTYCSFSEALSSSSSSINWCEYINTLERGCRKNENQRGHLTLIGILTYELLKWSSTLAMIGFSEKDRALALLFCSKDGRELSVLLLQTQRCHWILSVLPGHFIWDSTIIIISWESHVLTFMLRSY